MTAYFGQQRIGGLVLSPLDFGDERSAAKVAERLTCKFRDINPVVVE